MGLRWWPKAHPVPEADDVAVIRNSSFRRLWGAQILSQIAQNLLNFALVIQVYDLAQGTRLANISVALVILAFGVPSIFFAAAAGVYVDHWNRKHILVAANFLRALLACGYLIFDTNLILVLVLTFVISTITQFFAPAESAAIPMLVGQKNLLRANSLFIFTMYASFMVGYAGSAPVIATFGSSGPYWLTAAMFGLAGLLVTLLPTMRAASHGTVKFAALIRRTGHEMIANFKLIKQNHRLSFPILQLTVTQALVGVILALAPALSVAVLHEPLQNSSHVLIIPAGIGLVAGVLLVGKLAGRFPKLGLISVCLILAALSLVLLGASGLLARPVVGHSATLAQIGWYVALLVFLLGFMNAVVSSASQTLLQENTTDASRGKVFGALNMMINIAATLPILFAGILADLTSVTEVIGAIGGGLLVFAVAQYVYMHRRGHLHQAS